MIIGEYKSKLVAGNRIAFPKKFRDEMGNKLIITRGYEGCLVLVDEKGWNNLIADAAKGPFVSQSVRDTTRFLLGSAFELELDDQGRFVLPPNLRDYSQISDEVVFLGLGRWVELWSAKLWEDRRKFIDDHSTDLGEKLSKLEL